MVFLAFGAEQILGQLSQRPVAMWGLRELGGRGWGKDTFLWGLLMYYAYFFVAGKEHFWDLCSGSWRNRREDNAGGQSCIALVTNRHRRKSRQNG